ncbi:MAG: hypothetical protein K2Q06_06395 [Parvularculaceae bacterium]|nr:hypothetical protein [Parvularculaceae bacterium]
MRAMIDGGEGSAMAADQKQSGYFVGVAAFGLFIAAAGFSKTFFAPLAAGSFKAPLVVYVHGAAAFAFIALFVGQTVLARAGRYDWHVRAGAFGALLAVVVATSAIPVGVYAVKRDLAAGLGDSAMSSLVGVVTSMSLFLALVSAAVALRGKPAYHKRLMLLALFIVLWPAFFRLRHWFPGIPRPEWWLAIAAPYSLIPLSMARDAFHEGRIHPVWFFVGLPVVAEQTAEAALYDSPAWRAVAAALFGALSGAT